MEDMTRRRQGTGFFMRSDLRTTEPPKAHGKGFRERWRWRARCSFRRRAIFGRRAHRRAPGAAAENQQKARATLDAMVTALGGEKWLTLANTMQHGRTSGFYQGKPTGIISDFYEYDVFPDQTPDRPRQEGEGSGDLLR